MDVELTKQEAEVCDLLEKVVGHVQQQQPDQPRLTLRIAGGWVRDKLLGMQSHDIDIAVDHMSGYDLAQHVNQYLVDHGCAVHTIAKISQNPEQSKHLETATTRVLGQMVDFVNLRSEKYTADSRIPQIEFGTPLEDALRRDITINSMFYNIHTRTVEDFTKRGLDDLKAGIVRTPLEPFQTFTDDPLRVLRVLRFASRFDFVIDESTAAAIRQPDIRRDLDAKIRCERVGIELDKMASGPHPLLSIRMVLGFGLYAHVFRAPPQDKWVSGQDQALDDSVAEGMTRSVLEILDGDGCEACLPLERFPEVGSEMSPSQIRRALVLAAYLYPYHAVTVPDRKRTASLPFIVLRDGIKLSIHDGDAVAALHTLAPKISDIAGRCQSGPAVSRKELGLLIREAGARWPMATIFAAAVDSLQGHMTKDAVNAKYEAFIDAVVASDLVQAFGFKHIVNGKAVAKLLGIKPGPALKGILDQVMCWQLQYPQGSREECEEFILAEIAPTLQS
ncbi:CCA tRNA nucleotidyltransferase, mitochondrial [Coemansia sp. RSA 552]|nr:CCA tRNA nucleotidyltransferase, mitochondrial [Coemansia sp. RSA 552]